MPRVPAQDPECAIQGPGPGSIMCKKCGLCYKFRAPIRSDPIRSDPIPSDPENVSKVYNCREIHAQSPGPGSGKSAKVWPVSQIQGPGSGSTALRTKEASAEGRKKDAGAGHPLLIH